MRKILLVAMAALFAATSIAEAQNDGRRRPNWPDVCCGGPCCAKPKPGR